MIAPSAPLSCRGSGNIEGPTSSPLGTQQMDVLFHAVATHDPTNPWLLTFVSANVAELLGLSAEGLLQDPQQWLEHVLPIDRRRVIEAVFRAREPKANQPSPITIAYRYQPPDGRERRLTNTIWISDGEHNGTQIAYGYIRTAPPDWATSTTAEAPETEILAMMPDTAIIVDLRADGLIYLNRPNEALPFLDDPADASFKVRLLAYTHPLDQEQLLATFDAVSVDATPLPARLDAPRPVTRVRTSTGVWREWQIDWRAFRRDAEGRPSQLLAFWHDVTRERQHEREQVLQHELLARIADTIPHVLYLIDLDVTSSFDGTVYCSRSLSELLGYQTQIVDTVGWHRFLLGQLHPDDWPVFTDALRRIADYPIGDGLEFEYRLRAANGEWRWLRERDQVLETDDHGRATRVIGLIEDAHIRHQLEAQVRAERDFAQLVLNALGQGVLVLDQGGNCEYLNPAAANILGMSSEHAAADGLAATCAWLAEFLDDAQPATAQIPHHRPDGAVVSLHVTRSSRTIQGEPAGCILVVSDVTERQHLEASLARANEGLATALERARLLAEQAQAASRAKSDFLATMSHEIRTPLNAVIGLAEMLQDRLLTPTQREDALRTIRTSSETLLDLVNDILDFSKIEAGRLTLDPRPQDLAALVEDTVDMFAARARAKQVVLMCDLDPALPTQVVCDGARLRQVLVNLIGNALKFTPLGRIIVGVDVEQRTAASVHLRFQITDTGVGIPAEAQQRLFEPFEQASTDTARRYGGTGLGLAIVKRIVQRMGGDVLLESQVHAGTTVVLRIPMALDLTAERLSETRGAPPRIVLLAPNSPSAAILTRMLNALQASYRTTGDGRAAIQLVRQARESTVLLIDDTDPAGDGDAALRRIQEDPAQAGIRAVVVNAAPRDLQVSQLVWPIRRSALLAHLCGSENAPQIHRNVAPAQPAAQRPHILLAEDNPVNQQVARLQLQSMGVDADIVDNGAAALAAYRAAPGRYAAVLMDCLMPIMDGYQATRELRAEEEPEQHLPIIAMTANAQVSDRELCLAVGMDDYVSKPVSRANLAAVLMRQGVLPQAPLAT